jgi:hypothetical protein
VQVSSNQFRRVDVFSVSGGVGKTLLAVRLAQLQAKRLNAPVLLIDADIVGPCMGDLLESWASPPWDTADNLLHLICGRPEYLPERLLPGKLPVYRVREERPASPDARRPEIVTQPVRGEALLFCPSHAHSTNPRVEPAVIHALLGHESSGGWIGYLIDQVVHAANRLMGGRLGGVIVDHSPSLGALQTATLIECVGGRSATDQGGLRRAIMVTTPRATDVSAARDLAARITAFAPSLAAALAPSPYPIPNAGPQGSPNIPDRIVWIVNRIPQEMADWKDVIKRRFPRSDGWLEKAIPVRSDPATAESHAEADLASQKRAAIDADLEAVVERIFG